MDTLRLDKWLWAARFFRTRSKARNAIDGGHVRLNGSRAKPAKEVKAGDTLAIRRGVEEIVVEVTACSERRGNARAAEALYAETALSAQRREAQATQRRAELAGSPFRSARPTRKGRRQLRELKAKRTE